MNHPGGGHLERMLMGLARATSYSSSFGGADFDSCSCRFVLDTWTVGGMAERGTGTWELVYDGYGDGDSWYNSKEGTFLAELKFDAGESDAFGQRVPSGRCSEAAMDDGVRRTENYFWGKLAGPDGCLFEEPFYAHRWQPPKGWFRLGKGSRFSPFDTRAGLLRAQAAWDEEFARRKASKWWRRWFATPMPPRPAWPVPEHSFSLFLQCDMTKETLRRPR